MKIWPYPYPRRYWQERAEERFQIVRQQKDDFLLVACPAAGKTYGALPLVARLFESGKARRLVVVGHTDTICDQWKEAAQDYGLLISRAVSETKEFRGAVVTYQQIKRSVDLLRLGCSREPTVVLFDEVHHAAEGLDWGDAVRQAFSQAGFRLMLSGTPFRSDDRPIPFVTYEDGVCVPDFSYGYQEALDDGEVVRQAYFPTTDGGAEWMADGELKSAILSEVLSEADASARLRTILDPWGEWMRTTAINAHEKLLLCRQLGHVDAGQIWHCMDQRHAKETAKLVDKNGLRPRGRPALNVDTINVLRRPTGTSAAQALRRLRKADKDLHGRVLAGELTPAAAMREAGLRVKTHTIPHDPIRAAGVIGRHFTVDEVRELVRQLRACVLQETE